MCNLRERPTKLQNGVTENKEKDVFVGSKECRYHDIVFAIRSEDFTQVYKKWPLIASDLGVSNETVENLKLQLNSEVISILDVYGYILAEWRGKEEENATGNKIIRVLTNHKFQNAADGLKEKMQIAFVNREIAAKANRQDNFKITIALSVFFCLILLSSFLIVCKDCFDP